MKVLITGGAGFIGSSVAECLLTRGDQVVVVDNFCDYYDPERKEKNVADFEGNDAFELHRTDIESFSELKDVFEKVRPDKIIHLAARAGVRPSIDEPALYSRVNNTGTVHMLEMARMFDVKNFVFASSSSVYGNNKKVPFAEDDPVDFPISPYAATKRAGELIAHTYAHLYNIPVSCLRFFTVYGPKGRPDMAPYKFVKAVMNGDRLTRYGKGDTHRDYTYIDDIVSGVVASLDADYQYEIFNLGNSGTVQLNDFISIVEKHVGKKAHIVELPEQPGDVKRTNADISKSKKMLGYNPQTSFSDGMKQFVEWYKKEYSVSAPHEFISQKMQA